MYKLWRRQISKNNTIDVNGKKKEAEFSQYLSQIIKLIRKKEQFYIRILFIPLAQPTASSLCSIINVEHPKNKPAWGSEVGQQAVHNKKSLNQLTPLYEPNKNTDSVKTHELEMEIEGLTEEEDQILEKLRSYRQQSFYLSKTYLYTMFVRLLEIYDYSRQKITLRIKNQYEVSVKNWEKYFEQHKTALTECYQKLIYQQNYNVVDMISLAIQKQNTKICTIIPSKNRKHQISLKPLIQVNTVSMRKSYSIDSKPHRIVNDGQDQNVKSITNKQRCSANNTLSKRILLTEKRLGEREKTKKRQFIFKSLYGILNAKMPKLEEGNAFRKGLEYDALERNQTIAEERKKQYKRYLASMSSLKQGQREKE